MSSEKEAAVERIRVPNNMKSLSSFNTAVSYSEADPENWSGLFPTIEFQLEFEDEEKTAPIMLPLTDMMFVSYASINSAYLHLKSIKEQKIPIKMEDKFFDVYRRAAVDIKALAENILALVDHNDSRFGD